jgi:hypothetical protein
VLDDFSRYIVTWRLGPTMSASDVTATLDQTLAASGLDHITVTQRPRLLSDNGSQSYTAMFSEPSANRPCQAPTLIVFQPNFVGDCAAMAIFEVMLALTPSPRSGARCAPIAAFNPGVPDGNIARDGASGVAARALAA